jgi:SP family galactose:H+ symporter-like MFS transporter
MHLPDGSIDTGSSVVVERHRLTPWLLTVGVVTFMAGLLFGYDQGVISGALPLVRSDLHLGTFESEIITSWVTLGALGGALVAGSLADRIGRRWTSIAAGVLFAGGALLEAVASNAPILTTGRVLTGVAVGFASTVAPLFAAEMAPAWLRGRFVSSYQLAVTVGIFLAYLADDALTSGNHWRVMFALAVIPGILLIVGFYVVPESSRWLLGKDRRDEARTTLEKVVGPEVAPTALAAMEHELRVERAQGHATWGEVFGPRVRRPLIIGVGLSVIQQVTGINAIIYYANDIFGRAGFATAGDQATATLYAIGLVNVLATFIAIAYVDHFGRRPLLLAGLVGMAVSLAATGASFAFFSTHAAGAGISVAGIFTLVALVVFIASFAFSLGPVVWTIISEIYPNRVRGRAVSIATAANWGAAFLVTQFFLTIVNAIGEATTFFLLGAICVASFAWVYRNVPETRGRTLEEIQALWNPPRDAVDVVA